MGCYIFEGTLVIVESQAVNHIRPPSMFCGLSNVISISSGDNHSMALRSDGSVVGWGNPGAAGTAPGGVEFVQISAGATHNIGLASDGSVHCWGESQSGATNVPADLGPCKAVWAAAYFSLALTIDGEVRAWGNNTYGQLDVPQSLPEIKLISGGDDFAVAVGIDDVVYSWGLDQDLGPAPQTDSIIGISASGNAHVVVHQQPDQDPDFTGFDLVASVGEVSRETNEKMK